VLIHEPFEERIDGNTILPGFACDAGFNFTRNFKAHNGSSFRLPWPSYYTSHPGSGCFPRFGCADRHADSNRMLEFGTCKLLTRQRRLVLDSFSDRLYACRNNRTIRRTREIPSLRSHSHIVIYRQPARCNSRRCSLSRSTLRAILFRQYC